MRRLLLLYIALILSIAVHAQSLAGSVRTADGRAVEFAAVTLLTADSAFVCGTTCDADGRFRLSSDGGALLRVSCAGYKTTVVPRDSAAVITLHEDAVQLGEVEVVSMRQLVKTEPDRLSYNMERDPDARTSTLLDMLRKVPMVSVDGQDNVSVQGSSSFKYYRNGHPDPSLSGSPREVLRAIPANMVKRVEVITDPGAKYDAEGVTAILNIVMLSGARLSGLSGTASASATARGGLSCGAYVAGQAGRLTLSGNYNLYSQSSHQNKTITDVERIFVETGHRQQTFMRYQQPALVHVAGIQGSYELDSLNLLSASFSGYHYTVDINGRLSAAFLDADGTPYTTYNSRYYVPHYVGLSWNGRFDYEHRTRRQGEAFTLSYMFATTGNDQDTREEYSNLVNPAFSYTALNKLINERFTEHTFQADYVRPLFTDHKWEVGAKYILRLNRSHTQMAYEGTDDATDSRFRHHTQVAAAYTSWTYSHGPLSLRCGLRYEYSRLSVSYPNGDGTPYHVNLNDLVPSANIHWQPNAKNSLRLSWATAISRPGINYLNPAVRATPTLVEYGNANLTSARNTTLSLTFQHVGEHLTFNLVPSFSMTDNLIGAYRYARNSVVYSTYTNDTRFRRFTLNAYAQWMPTKTTTLMANGSATYGYYRNPVLDFTNARWYGIFYARWSQQLPWELQGALSMSINIMGRAPHNVYEYGESPRPTFNVSLRRSFLRDDRLTVTMNYNTGLGHASLYRTHIVNGDYTGTSFLRSNFSDLSLRVAYRFGKKTTTVKTVERTIQNDDEVGGISRSAPK